MGRPRNNNNPQAARGLREQMRDLRKKLRLTAPEFSFIIRLSPNRFISRERGLTDWSPEEVDKAKDRLAAFVADQRQTLVDTFGPHAIPALCPAEHSTANPTRMKLESPLSPADRAQVETRVKTLTDCDREVARREKALRALQAEREGLEAERAALQNSDDASRKAAETITVIETQLGMLARKIAKEETALADFHRAEAGTIRDTSVLIGRVCGPLLDQFRRDLATALKPFARDPLHAVNVLIGNFSDGFQSLEYFLKRDRDVYFNHSSPSGLVNSHSPESLRAIRRRQCATLRRVLAGKDVFSVTDSSLDAAGAEPETEEEAAETV